MLATGFAGAAQGKGILTLGGAGVAPVTASQTASLVQAQQAATLAAQSGNSLARMTRALTAMRTMQSAARAITLAAPSTTPNGLQLGGLVPDSGLAAPGTANPVTTWTGAKTPTQAVAAGHTIVTVKQTAAQAILSWNSFNIGRNTTLAFQQGSASWTALNEIGGAAPSRIEGAITAIGQVYLINQNGIIFTGSSQVNVGALIASTAGITANQYLNNGIYGTETNLKYTPSFTAAGGPVTVQAGAILTAHGPATFTSGGGYVLLLGTKVDNAGEITTPEGQTELAAGDSFIVRPGFGSNGNSSSTTRGNEIAVILKKNGSSLNGGSGLVRNDGLITAITGDITLAGETLVQNGVLLSTTSVDVRGTIHLLSSVTDPLSSVTLTGNSVGAIEPDLTSTVAALNSQRAGLIADSLTQDKVRTHDLPLTPQFNDLSPLDDLENESRVEITSGGLVEFQGGSETLANGGQVAVQATKRLQVDNGAVLDVSGSVGVALPMTANQIAVSIENNQLRDNPQNRVTGALNNNTVYVQTSALSLVPAGAGYATARAYTRGGMLEVSGYLNTAGHTIGEWTAIGGSIDLATGTKGAIVARTGSVFDISGGALSYQSGYLRQSYLTGSDGRLYNVNNAPADLTYTGVYNGFLVDHPNWGTSETYGGGLHTPLQVYEPGYTVGRDAGSLTLDSPTSLFNGRIEDGVVDGPTQIAAAPSGVGDPYLLGQNVVAAPGTLTLAHVFSGATLQTASKVTFGAGAGAAADTIVAAGRIPNRLSGASLFDAAALSAAALGGLSVINNGAIDVTSPLALAAGAAVILYGSSVDVGADLTAPGGNVAIANVANVAGAVVVLQSANKKTGNITLGKGAAINTAGLWTNLSLGDAAASNAAYINGGAVSLISVKNLTLGTGSLVDASAGAVISLAGGRTGGAGGNITLLAGDSPTVRTSGNLILNGKLASTGFAGGGALSLGAASFVISDKLPGKPNPAVVTLDPGFFGQGFSAYNLSSPGKITVEPGAVVNVVEPVYEFTAAANLVPSGGPVTAGASLILNAIYLADPTATKITQRPGASFSAITMTTLTAKKPILPEIDIAAGAAINVDPGQTIHLESAGQLTVNGGLSAPGGKIDLWSDDQLNDAAFTRGKLISIWLGASSVINADGAGFTATATDGASVGVAPAGGVITIGSTDSIASGIGSTEAAIIIRKGAVVQASGAAAVDRLATRDGLGLLRATPAALGQPVELAGNGGSILLSSERGVYLNGSLSAFAGRSGAAGGSLLLALETNGLNTKSSLLEAIPRILTITQNADAVALPANLAPGEQSTALVDGAARISVDQITAGGFGTIGLFARDAFRFVGNVDLAAAQAIELYRGSIVETNPRASVTLAAPYVLLSGQTPTSAALSHGFALTQAVSGYSKADATGKFTVNADLIDVQNSLFFGGIESKADKKGVVKTTQLRGFGKEILNSTGDLRFLGVSDSTVAATTLITTTNLDLAAREIYATATAVVIAGFDPTATGKNGTFDPRRVLTIGRAPGTTASAPLALGGSLSFLAPTIGQGGVVWQPLGKIFFGDIDKFFPSGLPGSVDKRAVVDFQTGSLTSVSATGLTIPFGGTTDGVNYTVNGQPISAATGTVGFGLFTVTAGVSPGTITVQALKTNIEAGAALDLSGGGVLSGEGFISGEGGSTDLTTTPFLNIGAGGGVTQPSLTTNPVYAIVAGAQPEAAPGQTYTQSGVTGSTPALGEQITIPVGIPGLAAGRYTLLPAAYALTPGGYRVQLNGAASLAAPPVVALPSGSYAVSGGTAIVNTDVRSSAPVAITITPAAALRQDANYDEESYSQFLIARAALVSAVRPVLPVDAGTLVLDFPTASAASLINDGVSSFAPAAGGIGGTLQIAGPKYVTPASFDIYGDSRDFPHSAGRVLLSAAAIDSFHAFNLEIGIAGAGFNAQAEGITLEPGATLTAARVILTALTSGITLKPGSKIDTLGQGALPFDSTTRGDFTDGGASVLDVGNGYLAYAANTGGGAAYGPISIDDGATIYTNGSIAFSTQAAVNIGVNAIYGGRYLDLALPEINIGDPATLGASSAVGLTLTPQVLQRLTGGAPGIGLPPVQVLVLAASNSLNFFGSTGLDLSGGNVQLVLDTPAIYGYGSAGDVARISAGTIVWNGQLTTNASTGRIGAGTPGGVLTNGPGTGTGTLDLVANTIVFGYSNLDQQVRDIPLSRITLGFSTVNLNAATEITANNQGTLAVYQSQPTIYGAPPTGGTLNLNTPLLTTADRATIGFTAGDTLNIGAGAGAVASTLPSPAAGGEVDLTGGTVNIDSAVILPSGKLDIQAAGNIDFGATSRLDLAGIVTHIFDRTVYGFGGSLVAESAAGNITQNAGSIIDVAATNNTAGLIQLTAKNPSAGAVALNGALLGGSTGGFASGGFDARVQTLGSFAALNTALNAGGFFQSRSFDIAQGDLTIGTGVIAHHVAVSLDGGSLTVNGLIDASGGGAGSIDLAAANLNLAGTANLAANGTTLVVDSYGQPISAINAPTISLTASTGTLTLAPGARLDLASADGVARGDLELNVPRLGSASSGDAGIEAAGPLNINGAGSIAVNAFWTYHGLVDPNGTASGAPDALITQAYLDRIDANDSHPFMAAAANNADLAGRLAGLTNGYGGILHLRPGVAIVSATPEGDLTVQGDLNLAGYRYDDPAGYGARVNGAVYGSGEPGVLTIRAGGDLNIYGSVTDGFAKPVDDTGTEFAKGWVLYAGQEPYGQTIVLPAAVTVARGTDFTIAKPVNFAVPITGGTFQSGAATPVALPLSSSKKVPVAFIATSAITGRNGQVLYAPGQAVPAGAVLPAGAVIGIGGVLPFTVSVGPVVWPANQPFLVTQGGLDVVVSAPLTLLAGSVIPGGSFIKFVKGEPGVSQPSPNGKPLFFTNGNPVPATYATRPVGADGTQGQLYPLAQLLPAGDLSWSINLVAGADTAAADPRIVQTASGLAAVKAKGDLTLADAHYGTLVQLRTIPPLHNPNNPKNHKICAKNPASCAPTYRANSEVVVPAFSVVRTGTGTLTLAAGGAITQASDYGIYTAGAQAAPILNGTGGNPYDQPQALQVPDGTLLGSKNAGLAALVANYQANYPVGGGNVTVTAQGNLNGFISTAFQPANNDLTSIGLTDTDAIGSWLWRQGGAGLPGAWWVEFGGLAIPPGDIVSKNLKQDTLFAEMVGFQGIGTLGGGNLTVNVGGDASALNLAVASTGRVLANGALVQDGGGTLDVTIGGALNFVSPQFTSNYGASAPGDAGGLVTDLRGGTTLAVGSIGFVAQDYNLTVEPNDPRTIQPLLTDIYLIGQGIDLAPGDGNVTINSRGDLVIDGVGNPGTAPNLVNQSAAFVTSNGVTAKQSYGGATAFSLWSQTTSISLFSAGGDVSPYEDNANPSDNAGDYGYSGVSGTHIYPPILSVTAQNGNIDFSSLNANSQVELAPAADGQLTLLAADSILGAPSTLGTIISMSGASPGLESTPFDPAITVTNYALSTVYSNFSPNYASNLLAFGPDTPVGQLHAGGGQPAIVYAGTGDIIDLQFGDVVPKSGNVAPSTWYSAAEPFDVRAGRDIVASGSLASPNIFLNIAPTDITSFQAGRDIIESSLDIAGPGTLLVQAGRNLYQADQGTIYSIGPLFAIDPNNRDSGATISVLAGVGTTGPDYTGFENLYLDPASGLKLENAGTVIAGNDALLTAWLRINYGYDGTTANAYTFFVSLSPTAQDVFLRQLYFDELNAAGIEYNNPTSVRYRSYLRGRDAIASFFPTTDATGRPISYSGNITLFGNSGIHTDFGGAIQSFTPGGETLIGVNGTTPPGSAGFITQGTGDIDIYALASVELGESRVLTTFGGGIVIWSATGNIDAGRGSKTTVVYTPVQRVYDNYGNVVLSPSVPSTGAGIATLNPIPQVTSGNINLVAPLGTIDAGEAGIRASGNINIAALHVANAANITVQGTTTGVPHAPAVDTGALAAASSASGAADLAAQDAGRQRNQTAQPSIWIVEVLGYGSGSATPPPPLKKNHKNGKTIQAFDSVDYSPAPIAASSVAEGDLARPAGRRVPL